MNMTFFLAFSRSSKGVSRNTVKASFAAISKGVFVGIFSNVSFNVLLALSTISRFFFTLKLPSKIGLFFNLFIL